MREGYRERDRERERVTEIMVVITELVICPAQKPRYAVVRKLIALRWFQISNTTMLTVYDTLECEFFFLIQVLLLDFQI